MSEKPNLSNRLKELRAHSKKTMQELADEVGVPLSTYRDWEYGSSITGEPYQELAKAYNTSIEYLLTGESSEQNENLRLHIAKIQNELKSILDILK